MPFAFPRANHAHTLDGALCDAIDRVGRGNPGRFENGRHNINDVVELDPDAAHVINVAGQDMLTPWRVPPKCKDAPVDLTGKATGCGELAGSSPE